MTTILEDAWASLPGVTKLEKLLADLKARRDQTPYSLPPEEARDAVIRDAFPALDRGEPYPEDLGARAAKAYTDAVKTHSEMQAVIAAYDRVRDRLEFTRADQAPDALEYLGERLAEVLTETREIIARSGRLATEAQAFDSGAPTAIDDSRTLRSLARRLEEIRKAQRVILGLNYEGADNARELAEALSRGHTEVTGIKADPVPNEIRAVFEGRRPRDVAYLEWIAECGRSWVPGSNDALEIERTIGRRDGRSRRPRYGYHPALSPCPGAQPTPPNAALTQPTTERTKGTRVTIEEELAAARAELLRLKIGAAKGLTPAQAARLRGDDEESVTADADA